MSKLDDLELKKEIYQNVYDALVLDPKYLAEEMDRIEAQIEILKECKIHE